MKCPCESLRVTEPEMACKHVRSFLSNAKHTIRRNGGMLGKSACYHSRSQGESPDLQEQEVVSSEWCEKAFSKMNKWSHSLKDFDFARGRLVSIDDRSRVYDDKLEKKMHTFKSIARVFIGLPSTRETMAKNLTTADTKHGELHYFCKPHETDPLVVSSLTRVSDILGISAQQRKVVRHKICPQVTQHQIWTGSLAETLSELKSEVDFLISHRRPSKDVRLAQQIVVNCLKFLEPVIAHDPEMSSWMRLAPSKGSTDSNGSLKWEEALEMSTDLINCLSDEKELVSLVSKLEVVREGLYQIRDVLIDKSIGYKETRYNEHLVQKKLTKGLGHSSKCLFTLLMYYLYGSVWDVEVEVRGGVHVIGGGKSCLYMGKILTVDDEKVVWNGVKELDRGLGLFKFVWESAGMKEELLKLKGHLWCVGAKNRVITYRGNMYFIHEISL